MSRRVNGYRQRPPPDPAIGTHVPQTRQVSPMFPHAAALVPARQVPPVSQHPVHVDAQVLPPSSVVPASPPEHTPAWQLSDGWQRTHASPPVPHLIGVVMVTHMLFWQQPLAQFDGPHCVWHWPATQSLFCERQSAHIAPAAPQAVTAEPPRQTPA